MVADDAGDWHGASRRTTYAIRKILAPDVWTTFCRCPSNAEGQGYAQRTGGMRYAASQDPAYRTSHIVFIDDDDVYAEDAFDAFRKHASDVPVIFKMMYGSQTFAHYPGDTLWYSETLEYGNVGTPMFLIPNKWSKLGEWKAHIEHDGKPCGGDFTFISQTVEKMGGVEWQDHVVALIRPKGRSEERHSTSSS